MISNFKKYQIKISKSYSIFYIKISQFNIFNYSLNYSFEKFWYIIKVKILFNWGKINANINYNIVRNLKIALKIKLYYYSIFFKYENILYLTNIKYLSYIKNEISIIIYMKNLTNDYISKNFLFYQNFKKWHQHYYIFKLLL